jgi:hypothetical protein
MQNLVAGGAGSPRRRNLRERAPVPEKKPAPLALGSSDEDDEDDEEEEEEDEGDEYNVSEEEEEEETTNGHEKKKKEEQKRDKEKEKEKKKAGVSANRRAKAKANGKAKELAKPAKGNSNKKKTAALFHRACLKHLVPEDHCEVPERLSATIQVRLHPFLLVADYQCNQPSDTHTHHHTHHRTRAPYHRTPLPQCIEELHDSEETQRQIELFASPSKADLRWVKVLPPWTGQLKSDAKRWLMLCVSLCVLSSPGRTRRVVRAEDERKGADARRFAGHRACHPVDLGDGEFRRQRTLLHSPWGVVMMVVPS